jgi:UDP-N-acetylmuramoylalanine--D-glutamate ligase
LKKGWIMLAHPDEERIMPAEDIPLYGTHNQENVMAAAIVGSLHKLSCSQISQSIKSFEGLEHRLEKVSSINGIDFFNDSKATNVDATVKSVTSFKRKIILILGGRDKGGDFNKLKKALKKHVRRAILIGEAKAVIAQSLENSIPLDMASSISEAVQDGYKAAEPGDVVLLAPACTSFDMFQNFEERGDTFKKEVRKLEKETR